MDIYHCYHCFRCLILRKHTFDCHSSLQGFKFVAGVGVPVLL